MDGQAVNRRDLLVSRLALGAVTASRLSSAQRSRKLRTGGSLSLPS
jgi:hypothetical protein